MKIKLGIIKTPAKTMTTGRSFDNLIKAGIDELKTVPANYPVVATVVILNDKKTSIRIDKMAEYEFVEGDRYMADILAKAFKEAN